MRQFAVVLGLGSSLLAWAPQGASAQMAVIQEPSLETFGVGTTVSAPDRGRVSLGGVGRSLSSRSKYGPLRFGSSLGLSSRGSGLSVGVRVQDLAEMDRAALEAASQARKSRDGGRLADSAERAYETLRSRPLAPKVARGAIVTTAPAGQPPPKNVETVDGPSPEKLLAQARAAEAAGKRKLALAYLRAARDRHSDAAQGEIDRLSGKAP